MNEDVLLKRQNKIMALGIGIILLSITILFLIQSVNADIRVNSIISNTDIKWSWSENVTSISIDGKLISDFDNRSKEYTLITYPDRYSILHTIRVYSIDDSGFNSSYSHLIVNSSDTIIDTLLVYLIFLFGLICLIIGFKEPLIAFGAFIFACMGIVSAFDNSFTLGFLYVLLLIASIFVAFNKR